MLAYVFWHHPMAHVRPEQYESSLKTFRGALTVHPPAGFRSAMTFKVPSTPWTPAIGYEDWYLVDDFASLGVLNEAAVSAFRKLAHDEVARMAEDGTAGLYRLISGLGTLESVRWATWVRKPAGESYPRFYEDLGSLLASSHVSLWQRQLSLGPATEFCLHSEEPIDVPAPLSPVTLNVRAL